MSIIRVGLTETKGYSEGYEAIFGKKGSTPAKKATAEKKAPAKKPAAAKKPAPVKKTAKKK